MTIERITAPTDTLCPICHEQRSVHGCSTSTTSKVDDNWVGGRRHSTVSVHIFCHHPDTYHMMSRARRYHQITPSEEVA